MAGWQQRAREMFVPLVHPPGHAQADFGEAIGIIGGVERKIHFFAFDLPHSDACFVVAYPAETTEAFCDGHVKAFAFFGGVPKSILYDNTKIAVARILGDGKRQRTRAFTELQSHYAAFPAIGFSADSGSTVTLSQRMGVARAKRFLLLSETIDAAEAQRVGLVDFVTTSQALMPQAEATALELAAGPTLAYGGIKQTMLRARVQGLESQLEEEAQTLAAIARSDDVWEGLDAFKTKRLPAFRGG